MSVAMVSMVLDCFPSGGSLRCLAIALADAADDDGASIYKSVATLAHQSVQSERTVQRVLPKLVTDGWLEVMSSTTGGRGRSTVYRIAPAWITRSAIERANARVEGRKPAHVELSTDCTKSDRLSPFPPTQKGDKSELKGDKNGLKGDSHGCHPNVNKERINPPYPPLTRGDCGQVQSRKPEQPKPEARTAGQPSAPDAAGQGGGAKSADQPGPGARPPWRWRESRSGVEAMGQQLGVGAWDEAAFGTGQGVPWPVYRAKVLAAFEAWAVERAPACATPAARLRLAGAARRGPRSMGAVLAGVLPCG